MTYKLDQNNNIIRIEDGAFIPKDLANQDYIGYLGWVQVGNTPTPYVAPTPIEITPTTPGIQPTLWAVAYGIIISDGTIGDMTIASVISGTMYMNVGEYWVFLNESVSPNLYYPKARDGSVIMTITEKYDSYFVINSVNSNGDPTDPNQFDIEIVRLV